MATGSAGPTTTARKVSAALIQSFLFFFPFFASPLWIHSSASPSVRLIHPFLSLLAAPFRRRLGEQGAGGWVGGRPQRHLGCAAVAGSGKREGGGRGVVWVGAARWGLLLDRVVQLKPGVLSPEAGADSQK